VLSEGGKLAWDGRSQPRRTDLSFSFNLTQGRSVVSRGVNLIPFFTFLFTHIIKEISLQTHYFFLLKVIEGCNPIIKVVIQKLSL